MKKNALALVCWMFLFGNAVFAQHQNVLIRKGTQSEVSIDISPSNPANMVAGSNLNWIYLSSDSGKTWMGKRVTSQFGTWGDPVVEYDTKENLYFFHLAGFQWGGPEFLNGIVCQKSTDYGLNFSPGSRTEANGKDHDKQWVCLEPNGSIHMTWTQFDEYGVSTNCESQILYSKSVDEGETWSSPKIINEVSGDCIDDDNTVEGAVPAIGPNGEVYVAWAGPAGLVFDRSLDGGDSWLQQDVFIDSMPGGWDIQIPGTSRANGLPVTKCDTSNGIHRGTIYVNWSDQRNGTDDTDIFFSKSTDQGNTWSATKRVNDDLAGNHQFFTWMDVDQVTGFIYLIWYDRRNYSDEQTDVYMAVSEDGGETFKNFQINENSFIMTSSVFTGDYIGVSAYNNVVRPIWTGFKSTSSEIYTALVDVKEILNPGTGSGSKMPFSTSVAVFPNPTVEVAYIKFKLKEASKVSLNIFNLSGQQLAVPVMNETYSGGKHKLVVDANQLNLVDGIYLYELITNSGTFTGKMVFEH